MFLFPSSCANSLEVVMIDQVMLTLAGRDARFELVMYTRTTRHKSCLRKYMLTLIRICGHGEVRRLRATALDRDDVGLGVSRGPQPADAAVGCRALRAP